MNKNQSVIVYAKRTAIGKMMGALSDVSAPKLASFLVKDALEKGGVTGDSVDEMIMGTVLPAGVGQAPARQAAIYGGLPKSVRTTTVNRVCGSGMKAVMMADQAIRLGETKVVFAGGMENMSAAPHLLTGSRKGYRFGSQTMVDHMQFDGLWDPYEDVPMGSCGEVCADKYGFTREDQDKFALESYEKARQATESGHFSGEIVPVEIHSRDKAVVVDRDEEPFSVDLSRVPTLRPAFKKEGTVTAGNASSINDGAALLCVTDVATSEKLGLEPLAKIVATDAFAQEPTWFTTAPIVSIKRLLEKTGKTIQEIDLFEINEAFSVVPMAAMKELGIARTKINPHGGAVAIGHPIGASGARILVTLIHALRTRNQKLGVASICIGGGEASSCLIEAF